MGNANLAHATTDAGNTVGSTEEFWILQDPSTADRPNSTVHRLEVSCDSPTAVLQVKYGRTESTNSAGIEQASHYFRGNQPVRTTLAGFNRDDTPPTFHHLLGTYYFSGGQPLIINFTEPVESLFNAESSTDTAFIVSVKRLDSASEVGYHINAWHEEY